MKNDLRKKQCKTESQVVIPALRTSNKTAFTLAEVLITLGIVGVVAALTMPSLIQSYQEKARVTALKKTYNILSQAVQLAVENEGTPENWGSYVDASGSEPIDRTNLQAFLKYTNLSKICGFESNSSCLPSTGYKRLDDRPSRDFNSGYYNTVLADGTIFMIRGYEYPITNNAGEIFVDINGFKGPNIKGKDVFLFSINKEGKVTPSGMPPQNPTSSLRQDTGCSIVYQGFQCTAWVIINGNQDYLHCDDLSWNGKTKCKQ